MIDRIDKMILDLLQKDSNITNLVLSERVGLSPAPCLRRVKAMEEAGIIKQYVALIDQKKIGLNLEFSVEIRLKSQTREFMEGFERRIAQIPEIIECCLVSGEWDYSLRVVAADLEEYHAFQTDKLMAEGNDISAMRSAIIIRKIKRTSYLPVRIR